MNQIGLRIAAEIIVDGMVQGVGYRAFAQRKAITLGLMGYAMNLRDGCVRLVVEGTCDSIETFIKDLEKGPPLARVKKCSATWIPATGKYPSFSVRMTEFD